MLLDEMINEFVIIIIGNVKISEKKSSKNIYQNRYTYVTTSHIFILSIAIKLRF